MGRLNTAGGRAGRPPGAWTVGAPAARRVGVLRASRVTSPVRATPCFVSERMEQLLYQLQMMQAYSTKIVVDDKL